MIRRRKATYRRDPRGASAVEYGLLTGLLAVAAVLAVDAAGSSVANLFQSSAQSIAGAGGAVSGGPAGGLGAGAAPTPEPLQPGEAAGDGTVFAGTVTDGSGNSWDLYLPSVQAGPSADQTSRRDWGGDGFVTVLPYDEYDGRANTDAVVQAIADDPSLAPADFTAVMGCHQAIHDGRDDWYLPAARELEILYDNRNEIGGFEAATYVSSTEASWQNVRGWDFVAGNMPNVDKVTPLPFRCVRRG